MTETPTRSGSRPVNATGPDTGQLPLAHGKGLETSIQKKLTFTRRLTSMKPRAIKRAILLAHRNAVQIIEGEVLDQAVITGQLFARDAGADVNA